MADQPKTFCDQILEHLRDAAKIVLEKFAEPDAIIMVIPWRVGQSDFPFGLIVQRPGEAINAEQASGYLHQLHKMTSFVMGQILEPQYLATLDKMQAIINEQEQRIRQLTQEAAKAP